MKRLLIIIACLAAGILAACGGSQDDARPEAAPADLIGGNYVGRVAEVDALVAVVADGERVRAYLCDGPERQIAEYAEGSADGARAELTSEGGAEFAIDLSEETATGTVTLPDGRELPFDAPAADGVAGLYELTFNPDGSFGGGSATGAAVAARVTDQEELGPNRIRYTVEGTVVAPDGSTESFARYIEGDKAITSTIALREIVHTDGESRGRGKGEGLPFTDKDIDF